MTDLKCFFENEPEYKGILSTVNPASIKFLKRSKYEASGEEIPESARIRFYCNDKTFHERNVVDLFNIILNCVSDINIDYGIDEETGLQMGYATQSQACDPINRYEFTKSQINYIREKRKEILCNNLIKETIKNYKKIGIEKLTKTIKDYQINCSDLILGAIYCFIVPFRNDFIIDLLKTCKVVDKNLLIFAVEECLDSVVVDELIKKSPESLHLFNERGEGIPEIIKKLGITNRYNIKNIDFRTPLFIKAVLRNQIELVKKLINNGANVNMQLRGVPILKYAQKLLETDASMQSLVDLLKDQVNEP